MKTIFVDVGAKDKEEVENMGITVGAALGFREPLAFLET